MLNSINTVAGGPGAFHIACGDFDFGSGAGGSRTKVDQYFGANFPWFGVVGNHDAETSNPDVLWLRNEYNNGNGVRTPLKNIFTTRDGPVGSKETTYSWDYGNAHFIVLNIYWDGTTGANADSDNNLSNGDNSGDIKPALLAWLQKDLALNNKPFIFVFVHEPPFPYNHHVGDSLDAHPTNRDAFWRFWKAIMFLLSSVVIRIITSSIAAAADQQLRIPRIYLLLLRQPQRLEDTGPEC